MKTSIRFTTARFATTLIAAAALLVALPGAAQASDLNVGSLATAPLAKGAGYERPNGTHQVRVLQRQLRRLGQRPGPIDGLFGPLTEGAVLRFQRRAGLRADGLVGPKTATRLARRMAALHRRAIAREVKSRRPQIDRSRVIERQVIVNSDGGPSSLLVALLIALCVMLLLALLSTLNSKSRESRRSSDWTKPAATDDVNSIEVAHDQAMRRGPERRRPAVIGYVSVSEEERLAIGEHYAAQAETIETFCRDRGLRLTQIVRDVDSAGTRAAPAPGLQRACQVLADGEACGLVVQELGRLTRSPVGLSLLLRWLADADRALIAIDNDLDTSGATGRRMAKALIEVGDWERERAQSRAAAPAYTAGARRAIARAGTTGRTRPEPPPPPRR